MTSKVAGRLIITNEYVFDRTPDGAVWTRDNYAPSYWAMYLEHIEEIVVVARIRDVDRCGPTHVQVSAPNVRFAAVPPYHGMGVLAHLRAILRTVDDVWQPGDLLVLRLPGTISGLVALTRRIRRRPYAAEVVGDPYDMLARGVTGQRVAPLVRHFSTASLKAACRRAVGVSYVTDAAMQRRYPPGPRTTATAYAHVELPPDQRASPRTLPGPGMPFGLVSVSTLAAMYKGIDVLLRALVLVRDKGIDARLVVVGGGRHQRELEALAADLGLADVCEFTGGLPSGAAVRERLEAADLFVLPTRAEGLPSALIEAMAVGLPAVASAVGGVGELLPEAHTPPAGDVDALAAAIVRLATDADEYHGASVRNLERAADFRPERLSRLRGDFLRALATSGRFG